MSRKNSRSAQSVSLFPFLAVLVCAMGALIFLLLVTTRRIRLEAVAQADTIRAEEMLRAVIGPTGIRPKASLTSIGSALSAPVRLDSSASAVAIRAQFAPRIDLERRQRELQEEWTGIVANLSRERAERKADRDRRMQELSALRQQEADADATLAMLRQRLEEIEREQEQMASISGAYEKERTALARQIAETQDRIEKVRRANRARGSQFAFVPYDGRTGTTRRPILIECTAEAIRFLPENIELTKSDLNGFTPGFNPVLAGSEALIDYWDFVDRRQASAEADSSGPSTDNGSNTSAQPAGGRRSSNTADLSTHSEASASPKPYVLLIVRPGGGLAFHIGRTFLARCSEPFGYELIEADWELALPPADPQAAAECRKAIARVLAEREKVIAQLGGRSAFARGLRLDRNAQGLAFEDQDEDPFASDGRGSFGGRESGRGEFGRGSDGLAHGSAASTESGGPLRPEERRLPSSWGRGGSNDRYSQAEGTGELSTDDLGNSVVGRERPSDPSDELGTLPSLGESNVPHGNGLSDHGRERKWNLNGTRSEPGEAAASAGESSMWPQAGQRASGQPSERTRRPRKVPKRWGIDNPRGSIGYERQVEVTVEADRLLIGGEQEVPAGQGESNTELVDHVIAALDAHAKTWGPPPGSFYWVPAVKFLVMPDGNVNYERLHGSLQEAGLATSVQFMLEASESAGKPGSP